MKRLVLFILTCLIVNTAWAVRVSSIYQAEIPVSSQSAEERTRVIQSALKQVLVKVSGKTAILDNPKLAPQLTNASTLMQEFSYANSATNDSKTPFILEARFDPNGVNNILHNLNVPIWGQNRPLIVTWVALDAPGKPVEMIDSSSENEINHLLKQQADSRGIPMMLPMMDVSDLNQVSTDDVVNMSIPSLQTASKRYGSDAILISHITQQPTAFSIQAKLVTKDDVIDLKATGATLNAALNSLIDNMMNSLAGRYSTVVTNNVQTRLMVRITGIVEQTDFAQVMRYVQHITAVADAQPMKISGNEVVLSIKLRGAQQAFLQAISLDKKLKPVADGTDANTLVYEWNHSI